MIGPHLYNLPKVKWIQGTWAGIDSLLPHINREAPPTYPITRTSGDNFGQLMGEYVIGNIIFWERNYFEVGLCTSGERIAVYIKSNKLLDHPKPSLYYTTRLRKTKKLPYGMQLHVLMTIVVLKN